MNVVGHDQEQATIPTSARMIESCGFKEDGSDGGIGEARRMLVIDADPDVKGCA
jgi:hypothetical protein